MREGEREREKGRRERGRERVREGGRERVRERGRERKRINYFTNSRDMVSHLYPLISQFPCSHEIIMLATGRVHSGCADITCSPTD